MKDDAPYLPPISDRLAAHVQGKPLRLGPLEVVHAEIEGRRVAFHCNMDNDPIQNCHRRGEFYEGEELAELTALLPERPVVLDIGANVGNHALYFAMFCNARRIMVIEPNPLAIEPLVANVLGNGLGDVIQLQYLGFGLSDRDEGGFSMKAHDRNLGATRMTADGEGTLTVRRGDGVFPHARPNLVKIDVEGMEMQVLAGIDRLIRRARPIILIEVEGGNSSELQDWAASAGYRSHFTRRIIGAKRNHILLPTAVEEGKENAEDQ